MDIQLTAEVLLGLSLSRFALIMAAERATKAMEETPFPMTNEVVKITGWLGFGSLLGSFGLGLAYLSIACGISTGTGGHIACFKRKVGPCLETSLTGLMVLLGCSISGAVVGSVFLAFVTLGSRGLILMGIILSLSLLPMRMHQRPLISTATATLSFLSLVFITVLLGAWAGLTIAEYEEADPGKTVIPALFFTILFIFPAMIIIGALAEEAFEKDKALPQMWLSFGCLVAMTGFLSGHVMGYYPSLFTNSRYIFHVVQGVIYNTGLLAGVAGSLLWTTAVGCLDESPARGLTVWISIPTITLLSYLQVGVTDEGFRDYLHEYLGTGGAVGFLLGVAGASGVALGSAVVSAGKVDSVWKFAMLVFGVECGSFCREALSFKSILISMAITLAPVLALNMSWNIHKMPDRQEHVCRSTAALGSVMMGAMVLGSAGLFTAALGSAGFCGMSVAALMATIKTFTLCPVTKS